MRVIILKYEDGGTKVIKESGFETLTWLINHIKLSNVSNISFGHIDDGKVLWEKQFVSCDVLAEVGE